jgi:hypothetical protein
MDWFGKALQIISGIFVLMALVAVAWIAFRGSYNQARVKELREDNTDLRARLTDAENKIKAHELREEALEVKVGHQQTEIELLTAMVTQRADLTEFGSAMVGLVSQMEQHSKDALTHWGNMETALAALLKDSKEKP